MPDQALARRHDLNLALPQYPAGGAVSTTRAKVQQAEHLISGALVELDTTYRKVETFVSQPGRSYPHQRWIQDKAAYYLGTYEVATKILVDRGMDEILHTSPWQRSTPYSPPLFIEPPRQSLLKRLMSL
jgi:hypothetical protein